jgi:acetylornithine deacetylase
LIERSIDILSRLVAHPSISSLPVTAMAEDLADHADRSGFTVHRFETSPGKSNVVAQIGPKGRSGLALCGHMDVVPTEGQGWNSDPFELKRIDGKLYGRGTCDMKGFIAISLAAVEALPRNRLKRGLSLIWTHDEEVGCLGAQALAGQLEEAGIALPESVLIGEPTDMDICRMHAGHTTIEIRITGRPAHSSKPHLGCSAIAIAAETIASVRDFQAEIARTTCPHSEMGGAHALLNVGEIHGGTAVNIVPEHCHLRLGLRPMPGQSSQELLRDLRRRISEIEKRNPPAKIDLHVPQEAPPMITPSGTGLEKALRKLMSEAADIGVPFATDGGRLSQVGTSPIVCGPGSIDQAHKADEYIGLEAMSECRTVLDSLIYKWCLE